MTPVNASDTTASKPEAGSHRAYLPTAGAYAQNEHAGRLADGLGFEPKTALRLYSISSAAPSTGLGHPSRQRSLVAALSTLPAVWSRHLARDC
jgi:hypothetical protein